MDEARLSSVESAVRAGFRLDGLEVDPVNGQILGPGGAEKVDFKVMEVLVTLAAHHGNVVSRDELFNVVWPDRVVTDDVLSRCIYQLRGHLAHAGSDDRMRMLVETLPKRGYRLNGSLGLLNKTGHSESIERPYVRRAAVLLTTLLALSALWWAHNQTETDPTLRSQAARPPVIAVLPFLDLSAEGDQAYFADGITEEIMGRLSAHRDLRVIARSSSYALRESGYSSMKISELLGSQYLLEGSVRKDGGKLRISAQLVDSQGMHAWSNTFDRELSDIFEIQSEIASEVAKSVLPRIAPPEAARRTPHLEAYQQFLIGREIVHKRMLSLYPKAVEHFDRAIAIDPEFADPYLERAVVLLLSDWTDDRRAAHEQAAQDLEETLFLQPDSARAHAARALLLNVRDFQAWSSGEGERILRHALSLDPDIPDARNWLSNLYSVQGRVLEAEAELEWAARIDPLSPVINNNLANIKFERGDIRGSEVIARRLLEVPQPSDLVFAGYWGRTLGQGRLADALEIAKRYQLATVARGGSTANLRELITSYAALGMWDRAEVWQDRYEHDFPSNFQIRFARRWLYVRQGRADLALEFVRTERERWQEDAEDPGSRGFLDLGMLLAVTGAHEDAISALERSLMPHFGRLSHGEGPNGAFQMLAWLYQQTGESDRADAILSEIEAGLKAATDDGRRRSRFLFAQNALLAGDFSTALDRLEEAVDFGWRDYYHWVHDRRWAPLRDDPRLIELMATVKAEIDAQRAQVEALESEEDFFALLDSAIAVQASKSRQDLATNAVIH